MRVLLVAPVGFTSSNNAPAIHGGYGNASFGMLQVLDGLKKEGVISELKVLDTSKNNFSVPKEEFDVAILNFPPSQFSLNTPITTALKKILEKAKKKYYHIVWETQPFPKKFKTIFEDSFFDGYLAPSQWGMELFKGETDKPVYYFPHFLNESDWNLVNFEKKSQEKIFTVLFIGQNTIRKGVQDAVISFARALGDKEDCQLLLKLTVASDMEIPIAHKLQSLLLLNQPNLKAQINYIDTDLSNKELGDLYDNCSLFLFCSRGEGFGLPAAEAMLQGLPVIYTNFSACPDVCDSPVNVAISATIDDAHSMAIYGYEKDTYYGVPKISEIIKALEFYYYKWKEDKAKYYEASQMNRDLIIQRFSYNTVKEHFKKVLNS